VHWIFAAGFFSSHPVHVAILIGGVVAAVSAVVGVFTVIRGQSFGGHALTDVSTAGGSGASLISIDPVIGFVGLGLVGGVVMDVIGVRRLRGRDLATGIVLGASIGLAALFLYLDTTTSAATGVTQRILFGSIFTTSSDTVPLVLGLGLAAAAAITAIYRPLLLSSLSDQVATARGVPVRTVGALYMMSLAVAVGLSSLVIGSILSTAMLIGPAATALRLTNRMGRSILYAVIIAVGGAWAGVLLAYDSVEWDASHQGLPVSFFIVALYFAGYLVTEIPAVRRRAGRQGR
jgi:zinc/manganese transport system permease protein